MEQFRKGDCYMKKLLALVCMITCIFGLTACGSEETITAYETSKLSYAEQTAEYTVVPILQMLSDDAMVSYFDENTADEVAYIMNQQYSDRKSVV